MPDCPLCDIQRHVIARDAHWTMCLNDDQAFLGRCFFALNRHETDVTALDQAERDSLWSLMSTAKSALDGVFSPDHYNYVFLMNIQPHVHAHIIPRYADPRVFAGHTITDGRFGAHYDAAASLTLPEPAQTALASAIREAISR